MKTLNKTLLFVTITSSAFANDYSVVAAEQNNQIQAFNQRVVHQEETEINKAYITALALDGMRRIYEAGLDFVGKDPSTAIRRIEAVKTLVGCGFDNALIPNNDNYWQPSYHNCVKATELITGDLNQDQIRILSFFDRGGTPDPRYYKSASRLSVLSTSVVPGPLAVIYWTMERIGSVALELLDKEKKEFLEEIKKVITLIEARHAMGVKAYISEMEAHFSKIQHLVDSRAKSNTNKETNILNLMNLRLTREGVSKLGQVAFEEANRAQSSRMLEPEKAKELALFVLKHEVIGRLINLQAGTDLREWLDEVVIGYDDLYKKFVSLESKAPIRMAAKTTVTQRTLTAYGFNDMNGISNVEVEASPLKNAFRIGRILNEKAKTLEYDPIKRATARTEQEKERRKEFFRNPSSSQSQNLQIDSGSDASKDKEEL